MIGIAIIDKNSTSCQRIENLVKQYQSEMNLQINCRFYSDPFACLNDIPKGFSGALINFDQFSIEYTQIQDQFLKIAPDLPLIFISTSSDAAIRGYENKNTYFLQYPVSYSSLCPKLSRILAFSHIRNQKDIILNTGKGILRCSIDKLYYIEVLDHLLIYHTAFGDFSERGSISKMEDKLADCDFCRCYNCYLVNLRYVQEVHKDEIVVNGITLPLGRTKKKNFIEKFGEYQNENH